MVYDGYEITVTVHTDPSYFGDECTSEDAQTYSGRLVDLTDEFLAESYPGADITVRTVDHIVNGPAYLKGRVLLTTKETG